MGSTSLTSPSVLGLGGTARPDSSTERALRVALAAVERTGVATTLIGAAELDLPMYVPGSPDRHPQASALTAAVLAADAVIVASPGYHGGYSGLIKNALDYLEDLRDADPPYLEDRAVGLIACAYGWQASTTTLVALRSVVHALRGWPTPLGVAINSAEPTFAGDGSVANDHVAAQLDLLGQQVAAYAHRRREALQHAA